MPSATVMRDLLLPFRVTVKHGEPHPPARGLGAVDVDEISVGLHAQSPTVINEDRVVGVVIWPRECDGSLFDFDREQSQRIRGFNMTSPSVVLRNDDLLAMSHREAEASHLIDPPTLCVLTVTQRRLKRTRHCSHSMSRRGCQGETLP